MSKETKPKSDVERYTLPEIVELVRKVMPIDLDPASSAAANAVVRAERFFTEKEDGLLHEWHGNVFLNPPYDKRSKQFLMKLMEEMQAGRVSQAIALFQCKMLQSISTDWFLPMLAGSFCVPFKRPNFWFADKEYGSPSTGTLLWYGGPHHEKFADVFGHYGSVLRGSQAVEYPATLGLPNRKQDEATFERPCFVPQTTGEIVESYKFSNKLMCLDGVEGMKMLPDESIPMVVTSPPWDNIRHFGGHPFHFESMADEIWRVLMPGGVVCWHVADQVKGHTESGTSARQKLYFHNLGFCVNTLVIDVLGAHVRPGHRYGASLQYVFVLSKGRPRVFNPIRNIENRYAGLRKRVFSRLPDGTMTFKQEHVIPTHRMRGAVWGYNTGLNHTSTDPEARKHPASMGERLAEDLIVSWSRDGDVVLDPMSGSGTTAKMALLSNRRYLGFEIHQEYHEMAVNRLRKATNQYLAVA